MDEATWEAGGVRLEPFLSKRGRAARMPDGIRVWGERAARAGALDATMGVITEPSGSGIAFLPAMGAAFAAWGPGEVFPYAPVAGLRSFREGWRQWIAMKGAGDARISLPIATTGVTGALCAAGHLLLDPGDTVLVPDRRWDGYDTTFGCVVGARLQAVRLLEGGRWDVAAWEAALAAAAATSERVVCVVNFPHNPTGYVPTGAEAEAFVEAVAGVAERSRAVISILFDDAYEGYVYADRPAWSIFYRMVDRHPRVMPIKCDGITKELLFWGGRLGAVTTALPEDWGDEARAAAEQVWENKLSAVVRGMVSSAATPIQAIAGRLLSDPAGLLAARRPILESLSARWAACTAALDSPRARAAVRADPFHGGLFALLNLRMGEAVPAAEALLARGIGVVPFHDPAIGLNALRVTYATLPESRLAEVVETVAEVVAG